MKKVLLAAALFLIAVNACGMPISDAPDIKTSRTLTGAEQLPIAVKNVSLPYSITLDEIRDHSLAIGTDAGVNMDYMNLDRRYMYGLTTQSSTFFNHPYGPFIFVNGYIDSVSDPTFGVNSDGTVTTKSWVNAQFIMLQSTAMTCHSAVAGAFNYVAGGTGVKDSVRVCAKDATNTYAWRTIY